MSIGRAQFVLDDGQGHAKPFGGTSNVTTGPPPPLRTNPYTYSNGSYGATNVSGGTVTLSGGVTFRYRWTGPAGGAPTKAVVTVSSLALWSHGASGSAANGLGSAYTSFPGDANSPPTGSSSGSRTTLEDVPSDGILKVELTPGVTTDGAPSPYR